MLPDSVAITMQDQEYLLNEEDEKLWEDGDEEDEEDEEGSEEKDEDEEEEDDINTPKWEDEGGQ